MTTFDDRERGEETKFKHELELGFKARNRRNKLFGLWIAQDYLGLTGEAATTYAKDVVMADFAEPGDQDMLNKVKADLEKAKPFPEIRRSGLDAANSALTAVVCVTTPAEA